MLRHGLLDGAAVAPRGVQSLEGDRRLSHRSPPPAECFLQVKSPTSPVVSCPFCKMVGYAVVFRGAKVCFPANGTPYTEGS